MLCTAFVHNVFAGVIIRGTRVIYDESSNETSVQVKNLSGKTNYLVQAWVDNVDASDKKKPPFVITPPLIKLTAQHENVFRLIYTGTSALPADRESVFWLNVKSIPGVDAEKANGSNKLQIATESQIKLFYRPANLAGQANEAYKHLKFTRSGNQLNVENAGPYFVTFRELKVGGKPVIFQGNGAVKMMVPPFGHQQYTMASASGKVEWSAINDYGATTSAISQ
jgi:P pilus assembly chaperone PapD